MSPIYWTSTIATPCDKSGVYSPTMCPQGKGNPTPLLPYMLIFLHNNIGLSVGSKQTSSSGQGRIQKEQFDADSQHRWFVF